MPAKLESLGPRSADGPLRTAVAKAIILPLWGPRGIDQLESLFALADYRPSLSTLTFEGGDLHWRLLH